ncbi:hypothetical protein PBAC_13870 [Pedobacter glucosidilyticus]|nr:hypothetical protein PBAC_13870 [Pedobacter glucosidilyticus]
MLRNKKEAVSKIVSVTLSGVEMFSDMLRKGFDSAQPDTKW